MLPICLYSSSAFACCGARIICSAQDSPWATQKHSIPPALAVSKAFCYICRESFDSFALLLSSQRTTGVGWENDP
jgi:hypothetical protein